MTNNTTTTTTAASPVIGTIDLPGGTISDKSYETAAWYRIFEYDAQTVEVHLVNNWAIYTIEGRTTHEHFPSLFAGVATGGGTMGDCDKASTYTVQMYDFNAAAMVEAGDLTLASGWEITESFHDHPVYCSGYKTDYTKPSGERYLACEHDSHENAHGMLVADRNKRGFLAHGYIPSVKNRKRHIKITAAS
jgi:hypothetical protein